MKTLKMDETRSDEILKSEVEDEKLYAGDVCNCCLSNQNLKNMLFTYYHRENPETYFEMITECFSSELIFTNDASRCDLYFICDGCIECLRDAFNFKNKVKETQKILHSKLNSKLKFERESPDRDDSESFEIDAVPDFAEPIKNEADLNVSRTTDKKRIKSRKKPKKPKTNRRTSGDYEEKPVHLENIEYSEIDPSPKKNTKESPFELDKDDVTCKICNETFPWHSNLVRHMNVHFPNHICHICAKPFSTGRSLKAHVHRHDLARETCEICKKTYKGKDHLKQHMKKHTDLHDLYKCIHCPERFDSYYKRTKHLIDVHGDTARKYKCKQCSKTYLQGSALSNHVRSVHLQEKKFVCNVCGFAFFKNSYLTAHMFKHNGIKNFECEICHKTFGRKNAYIQHTKIHSNEKNFVCSECGKAFNQKSVLKVHMKKHEKEKEDGNINPA